MPSSEYHGAASSLLTRELEARYAELRAFAMRKAGSATIADEVMQEAWLRLASQTAERISGAGHIKNPVAYLKRIISNLIIDHHRKDATRYRYTGDQDVPETVISDTPSPYQSLLGQQEFAILKQAILELPPPQTQILLLYRVHGLTMKQIGLELGLTVKAVEKHITAALMFCRDRLRKAGRIV